MKKMYFLDKTKYWFGLSTILICIGFYSMITNFMSTGSPFALGIDFTGGVSFTLNMDKATKEFNANGKLSEKTRSELSSLIKEKADKIGIENLELTTIDKYLFSLKFKNITTTSISDLAKQITSEIEGSTILSTDFIGPTVGNELQQQALTIIFAALVLLLIYITFRFEFWAAVAAILALVHDGLILLGMTALLKIEVNSAYVAAFLTVMGYSINDTIVIFDRIRENLKNAEMKDNLIDLINQSIAQTMTRSINTVATVLLSLIAIYLFGGASIKGFALVLIIGITAGAYSSIFIASPLLYKFKMLNQ